jgi:hypothetical protein
MEQVASQLAIRMQKLAELKTRKRFVTMVAPKLMANDSGTVVARADYGHVAVIDGNPAHKADGHRMLRDDVAAMSRPSSQDENAVIFDDKILLC